MPPGGYAAIVEGEGADWRALNRANWDDRVPVHLASSFYDVAGGQRAGLLGAGDCGCLVASR